MLVLSFLYFIAEDNDSRSQMEKLRATTFYGLEGICTIGSGVVRLIRRPHYVCRMLGRYAQIARTLSSG